ncbi:hypothetical protein H0H92_003161, partial [Tricholoma furcatifolium]
MDRPGECPDYYIEKCAHDSLRDTKKLIDHICFLYSQDAVHHSQHLVQPILMPCFALSCTDKLLTSLSKLAASDTSLRIQTHIAENVGEVEHVKDVFPKAPHYAGVYDHFGLLRHNTILGHAVWLTDAEVKLIAKRKAGISHCPTSNFYLTSGVAHIGAYLDKGVKVGLGTDVSGGYSPSILNCIQNAIIASIEIFGVQAPSVTTLEISGFATPIPTINPISTGASVIWLTAGTIDGVATETPFTMNLSTGDPVTYHRAQATVRMCTSGLSHFEHLETFVADSTYLSYCQGVNPTATGLQFGRIGVCALNGATGSCIEEYVMMDASSSTTQTTSWLGSAVPLFTIISNTTSATN